MLEPEAVLSFGEQALYAEDTPTRESQLVKLSCDLCDAKPFADQELLDMHMKARHGLSSVSKIPEAPKTLEIDDEIRYLNECLKGFQRQAITREDLVPIAQLGVIKAKLYEIKYRYAKRIKP